MLIRELINKLQKFEDKLGNVEVLLYMDDIDGSQCGFDDINDINITTDCFGEDVKVYIAHKFELETGKED